MPLRNNAFDDIPSGQPAQTPKRKPVKLINRDTDSPGKRTKTPKRSVSKSKVNVTYSLPKSLRDDMQALSFMSRKSQSEIVTEVMSRHLKKLGLNLPKRAA
jgi:hypothetical protein|tara:strand:+ start:857 stop:1159 length:303 start_codon:yes stop_codon:yes gene_type:complete